MTYPCVALAVAGVVCAVAGVILGWGLGAVLGGGLITAAWYRHAADRPAREARRRADRRRGRLL